MRLGGIRINRTFYPARTARGPSLELVPAEPLEQFTAVDNVHDDDGDDDDDDDDKAISRRLKRYSFW